MENSCGCGFYPTIVVPGIGDCKAYEEDEKGNRLRAAWPPWDGWAMQCRNSTSDRVYHRMKPCASYGLMHSNVMKYFGRSWEYVAS